ncbi:uncharacterized protein ARMOST_03330 [Armillaria ostoyae]|uniref:Uncharacterized protein n=1 Tax=Armillaria ostoyae TaxID=47428 RepID=A0A284QU88_ARMOS|nr:uncharacterized protein ARMOST_03330 [Armillaria ostoyae]
MKMQHEINMERRDHKVVLPRSGSRLIVVSRELTLYKSFVQHRLWSTRLLPESLGSKVATVGMNGVRCPRLEDERCISLPCPLGGLGCVV